MANREILAAITEGMLVIDSTGTRLGVISELFLGTESEEADAYTSPTSVGHDVSGTTPDVADGLGDGSELPDALRKRLLHSGYLLVDTGLLRRNVYVLADQIAAVAGDEVRLSVAEDDLIR